MHCRQSIFAIATMALLPAVTATVVAGHPPSELATVIPNEPNGCMVTVHGPKPRPSSHEKPGKKDKEKVGRMKGYECILFGQTQRVAGYWITVQGQNCNNVQGANLPHGWYIRVDMVYCEPTETSLKAHP
ncbi:hypothetical protein PspLS_11760 [Pyricularia sp. CBS 133598]|nr:hypothetical protein PspLS_11760 [Pyricularia sp. CBS 133598]